MSVDMTDELCESLLIVERRKIDDFRVCVEALYGPVDWKEDDDRVKDIGADRFLIVPNDAAGCTFYVGSDMPDSYERDLEEMLLWCEPGSHLEVMVTDCQLVRCFGVGVDGDVWCI